jgi:hypothetical protein
MDLDRPGSTSSVPYRAVLSARRVAALALAFPMLVHLVLTVRLVMVHQREWSAVAVAGAMLLVRYGCAHAGFARRSRWALAWIVAGVLISGQLELLGWLNALGLSGETFRTMAAATFIAGPCMQALYAGVFAHIEMRFIAEASDESADQAAVAAVVWLLAAFPTRSIVFTRTSVLANYAVSRHLITTIPLALASVALMRLAFRRRWLARVCAGQDPQWRVVPWDGVLPPGLPRVAIMRPRAPPMVLATPRTADTPYRAAESFEPRATLPARTTARS